LLFEPGHQRLEIVHHGAGRKIFAGRFLQDLAPVFGPAFFQDVVKPFSDFFIPGVVTRLRWLMQNLARDVTVQLEFQDGCNSIVVIIGGRVVDVCLGGSSWCA
jgi:hypothetical protein